MWLHFCLYFLKKVALHFSVFLKTEESWENKKTRKKWIWMGTGKIKGSSRNESEASSILQPQYANKLPGWMMTSIHKQLNTWRKAVKRLLSNPLDSHFSLSCIQGFWYFAQSRTREIPRNSQKNAKYREIRQKYFQIHVGKTYLILILAFRPVLFTPNVQIYLETSSLQRVNNVPKLPGILRLMLRKTGH